MLDFPVVVAGDGPEARTVGLGVAEHGLVLPEPAKLLVGLAVAEGGGGEEVDPHPVIVPGVTGPLLLLLTIRDQSRSVRLVGPPHRLPGSWRVAEAGLS